MTHHIGGRDDCAIRSDIVGDVEQRRNEQFVCRDALSLHDLSRGALRHQFRHEAAFCSDRHNHGILDLLRLHQPENFGAEILWPIGPANPAARHFAKAHVHAFYARRVDKDLVKRAGQRQIGELAALELDRDQRPELTILVGLKEVCADRRLYDIDEAAQDAVLVQTLDLLEFLFDMRDDRDLLVTTAGVRARIEAGMKQFDDIGGDASMLHQSCPHVVLRIGHANLTQKP